jgi:hypothetical protein
VIDLYRNLLETNPKFAGERAYYYVLILFVAILVLVIGMMSAHRYFDPDEFEHVHSAWYIGQGLKPYSDFFQHHHPLIWYAIFPALVVFGESTEAILALRLTFFILTIGIAFYAYRITKAVTASQEIGLFTILLLLSNQMFISKSIEIRPDVPQALFQMMSIYYVTLYLQGNNLRHLIIAGLAASLSFLFLQKAIFFLIGLACVLLFQIYRKFVKPRAVGYFVLSFCAPIIIFLVYLAKTGSFEDYIRTNWILNMYWLGSLPFSTFLIPSLCQNPLFWALAGSSVPFVFLYKHSSPGLKIITFLASALFAAVFLVRVPYSQYFLPSLPLLSIGAGFLLWHIFEKFRLNAIWKTIALLLIISVSAASLLKELKITNECQLKTIALVLNNTSSADSVYDGHRQFNLFRHDLHYFWFSLGEQEGFRTYSQFIGPRYADYDICKLIEDKEPAFVSNYLIPSDCRLQDLYEPTEFEGIYKRKR